MSDQVLAAAITGVAGIVAALLGALRWRGRGEIQRKQSIIRSDVPPIFAGAREFVEGATFAAHQRLIQPIETAMRQGNAPLSSSQMIQAAGSEYDLDRIGLYLFEEHSALPNPAARLLHLRHELERLKAEPYPRNLLALHHAARSLLTLARQRPDLLPVVREAADLLREVNEFTQRYPHLKCAFDTRRNIARLMRLARIDPAVDRAA